MSLFEGWRQPQKPREEPEKIASAAIEWEGEIFTGVTHGLAYKALKSAHPELDEERLRGLHLDDFITTKGRIVRRHEALAIAERNDQIKNLSAVDRNIGLASEDLKSPRRAA